jgi:thermitase
MNDSSVLSSQAQDTPGKKSLKKYLLFPIFLILLILISVIIFLRKDNEENNMPGPEITQAPQPTPASLYLDDQIIIKYKNNVSQEVIDKHLSQYGATVVKRLEAINRIVIKVPKGQVEEVIGQMKKDNLIEDAEPDYINQAFFTPNDPFFNVQWGLSNTGQTIKSAPGKVDADINIEAAWDATLGVGTVIAVLDSGIDQSHPDLSIKIIANEDFSGTGTNDGFGHGTHTAGIAAALVNNFEGIAGVCPGCFLAIGKVLNNNGSGPDSDVIEGILWAADNGAKVLNISFGSTVSSKAKEDAIKHAWEKGVVIVAATGNFGDTSKKYPAAYENVISVAATDNKDNKASYSTYGTWVSVAAPGSSIFSTFPTTPFNMQSSSPGLQTKYDYLSGTSMATPIVSGIAGLLWASPYGTSASSVVQRIFSTADKIPGTGEYWIHGRVNAGLAVAGAAATPPATTPTPQSSPTLSPPPATSTPTSSPSQSPSPTQKPTVQPTPTQHASPSPTSPYATPTHYCLGGCVTPTIPFATVTQKPQTSPTVKPSGTPVTSNPTQIHATPTKSPNGDPKDDSNILRLLLELLKAILEFFLSLLRLNS